MSLNIKGPNITIKKSINSNFVVTGRLIYDIDAFNYFSAVELVDGQPLELSVRNAINSFVLGCKSDGIWDAIKASCILAGARTLNGALVPLKGTAPTRFGFVDGDYNRKTGLVGNGSSKYLDSNRNNNADPQNNRHLSIFISSPNTIGNNARYIAAGDSSQGDTYICGDTSAPGTRLNFCLASGNHPETRFSSNTVGFLGLSRSTSTSFTIRGNSSNSVANISSVTPRSENFSVFARPQDNRYSNPRLSFYSIGEALDLALLDARVTTLMNAFAALP